MGFGASVNLHLSSGASPAVCVTSDRVAANNVETEEARVEMHQIRYFLAVAKCLNFTRAAEDLQIAQPSLTRAIHKLEVELGGPLFRRERMNTHLTELGRMVLPELQAILTAAEAAKTHAHRLKTDDVGSLALGVSIGLDTNGIVAHILEVAHSLRGLEATVEVARPDAIWRKLIKGEFDAAILNVEHDAFDRLDLLPVETDLPVVAFAPGHRFNKADSIELEELGAEPLAVCSEGWAEAPLAAAMEARGISRLVRYRSNDPRWVAEFVRRGLGVAVMSVTMATSFGICHRALAGVGFQQRSVLATVAGRRHSRAVAMLIQYFRRAGAPSIAAVPKISAAS